MTNFVLKVDLSDHEYPGNAAAQHAAVAQLLAQAAHALRGSPGRSGTLTTPNPHPGGGDHVVVGSWEFGEEDPASQAA
jgi:hypothetical protein